MAHDKSASDLATDITKGVEIIHARAVWLYRALVEFGVDTHRAVEIFPIIDAMCAAPHCEKLRRVAEVDATEREARHA
jgi:hypothetical protein